MASSSSDPASPNIKMESMAATATTEVALTSGPLHGNMCPNNPEVALQVSGAKRKADEENTRSADDEKRARKGSWHKSKYANLTILCNGKTWKSDCAMLFWRCPALELDCASSSSVAGQYELTLDDEDPEALGSLLSYMHEEALPKFATLHEASPALRIGLKYEVPEYKAYAKSDILARFDAVEIEERQVEEFITSLPTWWDMDQHHVEDIKSAALKVVARKVILLLERDDFQSLLKSSGVIMLDAMGALAVANKPPSTADAVLQTQNPHHGEHHLLTEAQARSLFLSNDIIRRLLAIDIEKSVQKREETLRKEFQLAQVEIKRQLTSSRDKAACGQARIEVIQAFTRSAPFMGVRDAWNVAKLAKVTTAKPGA